MQDTLPDEIRFQNTLNQDIDQILRRVHSLIEASGATLDFSKSQVLAPNNLPQTRELHFEFSVIAPDLPTLLVIQRELFFHSVHLLFPAKGVHPSRPDSESVEFASRKPTGKDPDYLAQAWSLDGHNPFHCSIWENIYFEENLYEFKIIKQISL